MKETLPPASPQSVAVDAAIQSKYVRTTNAVTLIGMVAMAIFIPEAILSGNPWMAVYYIVTPLVFLGIFFHSRRGGIQVGRHLTAVFAMIVVFSQGPIFGKVLPGYLWFFPLSLAFIFMFPPEQSRGMYVYLFISLVLCTISYAAFSDALPLVRMRAPTEVIRYIPIFVFVSVVVAGLSYRINLLRSDRELASERKRAEQLLLNMLPHSVAEELKENGKVEPLWYEDVSVMFTDFVGFTRISRRMLPDTLVNELDECFTGFDEVVRHHKLEKLKTIGDAYMCAGGLPGINQTHPVDICLAALQFRSLMERLAEDRGSRGEDFWRIRIGIHTGPVTTGVIGKHKFAYDIWGDTVNIASRMESASEPGMINISRTTHAAVQDFFECEQRGQLQVKSLGLTDMFFLNRIRPELSQDSAGLVPNAEFQALRDRLGDFAQSAS